MLALAALLPPGLHAPLALRAPSPTAPGVSAAVHMVSADVSPLYGRLDAMLRRARSRAPNSGMAAAASRALSNKWTDSPPARLVEAALVSGKVLLDGFDEGLELLTLAEDESELALSSAAYASLMRLGLAEQRHRDVLALLGRLQARGADVSAGALLSAMRAADALGDFGAVARLFTMLPREDADCDLVAAADAAEAAASAAETLELETIAAEPQYTDERRPPPVYTANLAEAFELALRAHTERGDVPRALGLVDEIRARGHPLPASAYGQLASLAKRTKSAGPLLALTPADLLTTAAAEAEPVAWRASSIASLALAGLGTVERALVVGLLGLAGLAALGFGHAPEPADPFALL